MLVTARAFHRQTCRLCDSRNVELVVKLAPIPVSEHYATDRDAARTAPRFPVDLYMCADCGHVQQLDVVDAKSLWENYTYYSGDAKGMPEHFAEVAAKVISCYKPPARSLVVDIGSNDGSLLRPFKNAGFRVLGIDPASEIARRANEAGVPTIADFVSVELARKVRREHGPAHVVCAFNAFAHTDDLGGMADAVRIMMAPEGLFFFEVQYLLDMIDRMLIATIFHEHMSHHSVKPMVSFLGRHGMELIEVERVPIQHGSLIGTAQLTGAKRMPGDSVHKLLALEEQRGLAKLETMRRFGARIAQLRARTSGLVAAWKSAGASIAGYGAARSGPTLISQLGLTDAIEYIFDDHPQKVGRYSPGDGIPILPTAELLRRMPDYTVILAWVHAQKIIETNSEYLAKGGHFVVLCPDTRVVGRGGDLHA